MPTAVTLVSSQSRHPESDFFKPVRLVGALAEDVAFTTDDSFKERINVAGASKITVGVLLSGTPVVGTLSIDLHRMLSDATEDDTDGTRSGVGAPTTVDLTNADEEDEIEMALDGEEWVEVELTMSSGGSDVAELAFVEVFLTPRR